MKFLPKLPKRLYRTLRSRVFAEGLKFLGFLFVSNAILLALFISLRSVQYFNAVEQDFQREFATLEELYQSLGPEGVREYLQRPHRGERPNRYSYLLLDPAGNPVAGNLKRIEELIDVQQGWFGLQLNRARGLAAGRNAEFITSELVFGGGSRLILAQYIGDARRGFMGTVDVFASAMTLTALLSIVMMLVTSAGFLRLLEPINRDIDIVMAGDLSHRLVQRGDESEFDRLVAHVNEMLDRIQELMEGVKQVSDNIAHDLRTPLTRLRNNLVSYERAVDEEHKAIVRELISESDGLIATFNALLRIAKIELGETRQRRERVALHALVAEVIELYEPVAQEKHIAIASLLDSCVISADRDLIFQAVVNVLDNAVKYTPQNGRVMVEVFRRVSDGVPGAAVLRITDTGRGIQEQNKDKVFRRFFREDSSRTLEQGNGLGLSLVAAVVKIHSAKISLDNRSPGLEVVMEFPPVENQ